MIFGRVKEIVAEQLGVELDEITPETSLLKDLGADSLDAVEVMMALEDEFDIEVPDDEVEGFKTIGDIAKYIETKV